ncbi:MAG: hypothetical protein HY081_01355 [Gammaproteobacteria bacterium]|nr:hypothetical protein [Gammaproteobacteria bacterium]
MRKILSLLFFVTSFNSVVCGAASSQESLEISELNNSYVLKVPVSRLVMIIPKDGLSPAKNTGGAADSPRYFYLEDKTSSLIISGWFEPEQAFSGMKKFWQAETEAWKRKGILNPQNVSFVKIGGWDAITYDMPIASGSNPHIRAHWLQAGTWIDIHLSIISSRPRQEAGAQLQSLLKAIQVKDKK